MIQVKQLSGSAATLAPEYDSNAGPAVIPAGESTQTVCDDEFFELKGHIEGSDGAPLEFIKPKRR